MIRKVLIANRGEISIRINRTLRKMGIKGAVIFSDADRNALHVITAEEAYHVGPAPSTRSYLNMDRIIEVAKESGADAIHPGYGFLSENPEFARRVREAGLIFIGPTPESMELAGDKLKAKESAKRAGVPLVPGSEGLKNVEEAIRIAEEIGFPVLIKAARGGGGKGMRIVERKEDFAELFSLAVQEAESAFGDGTVYIEKYITNPHHVEIQILADQHGNVIALGERECSIQRRHQKIIEESPSPFISDETRRKMMEAAVNFAREIGYVNAGTVEFIVDENQNFYFLEMNTRLQVEHPVTEWRYGIDLVEWQIRVARGESIEPLMGLEPQGHAIEVRIYAEDPESNFAPSPGEITFMVEPSGPYVRLDSGVYYPSEIPIYYDPMISKLIAWGPTRKDAIDRILSALREYRIFGIKHNIDYLIAVIESEDFKKGIYTTRFTETFEYRKSLPDKELVKALPQVKKALGIRWNTVEGEPVSVWKRTPVDWEL